MPMDDFALLIDFHRFNERQGPGSTKVTEKALGLTGLGNRQDLKIADIGCGTGGQTLTLARKLDGHITAVDLFPEFLEELRLRAAKAGLEEKIKPLQASMDDLPQGKEEFDLIWSEGAIYLMGFEAGISYWKQFLKPGGILAVSDITWITSARPAELEEFWQSECPGIKETESKLDDLVLAGFTPLGHFILPEECWIDQYYLPLKQSYAAFLERQNNSPAARELVEEDRREYEMYLKYKAYYSYGFYVARNS